MFSQIDAEEDIFILKAIKRNIFEIKNNKIIYYLNQKKDYIWSDPEERVRAYIIAYLIFEKGYPPNRIKVEVKVPRRTVGDFADIVVYSDDSCKSTYLVVECKSEGQTLTGLNQGIEQLFGNCNSLRSVIGVYEEYSKSILYDIANFPAEERQDNIKGSRDAIPSQYGLIPEYTYIAGVAENDIKIVKSKTLENKIKRAHSIIWAGGKRDPLVAFDEWSKLLFAKVEDERTTPNGKPRKFQIGKNETTVTVAGRIHELFEQACCNDSTIFSD